ncbi:MAG TPA: hypothetical protein VFT64_05795 [Rickettsiales bacterium]|nr:hypothetical protein [Rickettsiales bacterium]
MAHYKTSILVSLIVLSACADQHTSFSDAKANTSSVGISADEYVLPSKPSALLNSTSSVCGNKIPEKNCPIVSPPTTPQELLSNIKYAAEHNILLQDDILTNDKKLWQLFATRQFYKPYSYNEKSKEYGYLPEVWLQDFPVSIDHPALHNPTNKAALRIELDKHNFIDHKGKKITLLSLRMNECHVLGLSRKDVEEIYGDDWKPFITTALDGSKSPAGSIPDKNIIYDLKDNRGNPIELRIIYNQGDKLESLSVKNHRE